MPFDFSTPFAIFVQCIGFAAMAFGIGSYQAKRRGSIIFIQVAGSLLWSAQFILLGQWTGAILNVLAILRGLCYVTKGKWNPRMHLWMPILFSLAFLAAGVLTVPGLFSGTVETGALLLSLLPVLAMVLSSFGLSLAEENKIRAVCFFASPPWMIYDLLSGSVAGVINEAFVMVSIAVGLARYRNRGKKQDES